MVNLDAVIAALSSIADEAERAPFPSPIHMSHGRDQLMVNADELFGPLAGERHVRLMVTMPSEAAEDRVMVEGYVRRGMDVARINCAHDDAEAWDLMIRNLREAAAVAGRSIRILMDLAGPKCRTEMVRTAEGANRLHCGDKLFLAKGSFLPLSKFQLQATCSIPTVFEHLETGAPVWVDDGRAGGAVEYIDDAGAVVGISHAPPKGVKLRADKGLNFPDTNLGVDPLTAKDLSDLDFVATHADMIGYSFVQSPDDIALLQHELIKRLGDRADKIGIVAKIETPRAVRSLPEIITQAAGQQPFAVMIARGDLGVEIGFMRLAEIQEEMLWLCEAAHVPVIWATEVLNSLIKKGVPSRGEMTDAAMSARAECVMLNKGPYIAEALDCLNNLFLRMAEHQHKKTPRLRALKSW